MAGPGGGGRRHWDREADFYEKHYRRNVPEIVVDNKSGYSRIDLARLLASWTVHDCFIGAFSWDRLGQADPSIMQFDQYQVDDPAEMSSQIKNTARAFGADLVGICNLNRNWVYSHDRSGDPVEIPAEYEYAIVMAIAMDKRAVLTSPSFESATATGIGYSKMAFTVACMAQFIRNLRYKAISMGNDTALSIPLAIEAGLGQLGRNGLLVTKEYGPCVRICKLFTNLPLLPDEAVDVSLSKACNACRRCAKACKVDAISFEHKPSLDPACPSNNSGILRWPVNADKSYSFWIENGATCSDCIAACPYVD